MRENNKLTSLLKYICMTTAVLCTFVLPAKADFDASAFISDILSYENPDPDYVEKAGDVVVVNFWGDLMSYVEEGTQMCLSADWDEEDCGGTSIRSLDADANEWAIHWAGHGTLYGIGACSTSKGATSLYEYAPGEYDEMPTWQIDVQTVTTSDDITNDGGDYLWCKMTGVADTSGNDPIVPSGSQWDFVTKVMQHNIVHHIC